VLTSTKLCKAVASDTSLLFHNAHLVPVAGEVELPTRVLHHPSGRGTAFCTRRSLRVLVSSGRVDHPGWGILVAGPPGGMDARPARLTANSACRVAPDFSTTAGERIGTPSVLWGFLPITSGPFLFRSFRCGSNLLGTCDDPPRARQMKLTWFRAPMRLGLARGDHVLPLWVGGSLTIS